MGGTSYSFLRCLGRGGFGEVYLATRRAASGMESRVAVKILRSDVAHPELALARLKDEGRLLAALDHPAILRVVEMTRIEGRIALVTEYIEGVDLSRYTHAEHRLPPRVVVGTIAEVAHALHSAWTTPSPETGKPLQLVHRDIKPENIRLSKHGEVKLLDFGIARSDELGREARTATGHMAFTPGYAAPEAFLTLSRGAPTDIFALGATTFRLLVGERFFGTAKLSQQAALCASQRRFDQFVLERVGEVEELHSDLRPLLGACLQWDPKARPSADDVQRRGLRMAEAMVGPHLRRWARSSKMPGERDIDGAAMTGRTLPEDDATQSVTFDTEPGGLRAPFVAPPVPEGLKAVSPEEREHMTVDSLVSISMDATPMPAPARDPGRPWWALPMGFALGLFVAVAGMSAVAALLGLLAAI